ncbi:hypothetical protein KY290_031049 [Solanum tuberosum]|uniref:Uncharacterized protein n=1 Tax=Solanum tuberosum TaxID=4113 RepID=A0ABQ7U9M8_SOLTU|nr:hypothetical protein KY290_031049 [Solanum tuberosum]
MLGADQQSSKRAEKLLSSRLPALIFEEVALDTRDIQERPALVLALRFQTCRLPSGKVMMSVITKKVMMSLSRVTKRDMMSP